MSTPFAPASPQEASIEGLFIIVLVICGVILVLVTALVLYSIWRFRGRTGQPDPRPVFGSRPIEIAWTAGPLLVLAFIFAMTLRTALAVNPDIHEAPDLVVVGNQWWWDVRYPKLHIETANEIHLPVGHALAVEIRGGDVIHDFWVPQLQRKVDAIPGHPNYIWLEASKPGTYLGACAEYCGNQHAWMRLRVIGEDANAFEAWVRQQAAIPGAPTGGEAARGAKLFQQHTCSNCHAVAGTEAKARIGPDLTHVSTRKMLAAERLENTPENLYRWIKDPNLFKPGSNMPNLQLSPEDARAIVSYLEGLR
ncbi:MAG TPA: cytochrome c oxidase subunit II [Bryobacteraceae bacterium]|nr:cytochrome c oxidase subunit II [Bryobacteraceae bacterium]